MVSTFKGVAACPQCNFDYDTVDRSAVPAALTTLGHEFQLRLRDSTDPKALRSRPRLDVWSALEYACHVRDVLLIQRDRLYLALVEDTPSFARMYRDERAVLARYNQSDPAAVAEQLRIAATLVAEAFSNLDAAQWERRLVYNWPEPAHLDLLWLGAHTIHEARHHLGDFDTVATGHIPGDP